jgi:hypothetical protein
MLLHAFGEKTLNGNGSRILDDYLKAIYETLELDHRMSFLPEPEARNCQRGWQASDFLQINCPIQHIAQMFSAFFKNASLFFVTV